MNHKGYTLNYFINFFKSIPDHQWCTGQDQKYGTVQHCAIGHALRDNRTTLGQSRKQNNNREKALEHFLDDNTFYINDNVGGDYAKLGKTPRGRILKALRNRKRYGNIFGNKE